MSLLLHPDARREADRAAKRYAEDDPQVALHFTDALDQALDAIEADPLMYPVAEDDPDGYDVRNYIVRRFPFRVIYWVMGEQPVVLAYSHHARMPGYWHDRLSDAAPEIT